MPSTVSSSSKPSSIAYVPSSFTSASGILRPRAIGDFILPQLGQSIHMPASFSSNVVQRYGPLIRSSFLSVSSGVYSACFSEILCAAFSPSSQNLAIDNPALHIGSEASACPFIILLNCLQPLPLWLLISMSLKLYLIFFSSASRRSLGPSAGVYFLGTGIVSIPSLLAKKSKLTSAGTSPMTSTGAGVSGL